MQRARVSLPVPEVDDIRSAVTPVDIYLWIRHDIPEEEGATIFGTPCIIFRFL